MSGPGSEGSEPYRPVPVRLLFRDLPPQAPLDLGELENRVDHLLALLAYLRLGLIAQESPFTSDFSFVEEQLTYGYKQARDNEIRSLRYESPMEMVLLVAGGGVPSSALADALVRFIEEAEPRDRGLNTRDEYLKRTLSRAGVLDDALREVSMQGEVPSRPSAAKAVTDIVVAERLPPELPY